MKDVTALDKMRVHVGILEGEGRADHGGLSVAAIGAIHEFGAPKAGIPQRSFLQSTLDERSKDIDVFTQKLVGKIMRIEKGSRIPRARAVLGRLGAKVTSLVKRKITKGPGIPPPLAPATIARKGSDRPLVDTGLLLASITWKVEG